MMGKNLAAMLAVSAALGACATGETPAARTIEDEGRAVAAIKCSSCHAIGRVGQSSNENAPPLRNALRGYNPQTLESDFIDGMRVGHSDMPRIQLREDEAAALIAYLQSIQ